MTSPLAAPIAAVVFDWAGTMVDFGSLAPVAALRAVFAEAGSPISEAEARREMGMAKRDHVAAILTRRGGQARDEALIERLYHRLEQVLPEAAARHAALIPGALDAVADIRARGTRIGSTTGYTRAMMAAVARRAAEQGYAPEALVCAGETPHGRPSPLMLWKVLVELGAWPAGRCVKVDDAAVGVAEGRAAGCWSVGVAGSGNEMGLSLSDYRALSPTDRDTRLAEAGSALTRAGADYVIPTVADLPRVLDAITVRIAAGERGI